MYTKNTGHIVGRTAILSVAVILAASLVVAQAQVTFPTLDIRVPVPPRPLVAGGAVHLAYEIHLTNFSGVPTRLDSVDVREAAQPEEASLASFQGAQLDGALLRLGAPPANGETRVIPPGQSAVLFLWITLTSTRVPTSLTHRIRFNVQGAAFTIEGVEVLPSPALPRVVGPPLEGDAWLAVNGPGNAAGHRRALIALGGQARIAQRFAVDWVRLYDDGRTVRGEPLDNNSYRAFGANVLAVDDGIVREVLDGIPENVPDPTARVVPITPKTLVGNYVLLDIGGGAYAVYAHLQLASVQVKAGDRVRKGQVLGRVGNTGNSSEPHLHFHIVDRPSAIDAEGVPYALESFLLELAPDKVTPAMTAFGNSLAIGEGGMAAWRAAVPQRRQNELPLLDALVTFQGP
jgi:hypothetical protein